MDPLNETVVTISGEIGVTSSIKVTRIRIAIAEVERKEVAINTSHCG